MTPARAALLDEVARSIPSAADAGRNLFVGIDGVDGAGKTVFADELAVVLAQLQPVARVSIDGFHRQRAERYRLGRDSAEGFWLDSYDYDAFLRHVVHPLRSGDGPYLEASHDLDTDELLVGPARFVDGPTVVMVDGIFLHRDELTAVWDFSVFLDVLFAASVARMGVRDGSDPDPAAASNHRYVDGQRIYLGSQRPAERATIVVDNGDLDFPFRRDVVGS